MPTIGEPVTIVIALVEEMCENGVPTAEHEPIVALAFCSELEYLDERLRPFGLRAEISMPKPPYDIDPLNQQIIVRGKIVEM